MRKLVFPLVVVLFLGVSFFLMTTDESDFKPSIAFGANAFMEDVVIEQRKAGQLKWRLTASKAWHLNTEDIKLEGVSILMPDKEFILRTEVAFYSLNSKNFSVPGEIKAYSKDYEIVGKRLYWDAVKGALVAEKDIRITGKGFEVQGDDLYASEDRAILNKNVKAVFHGM